MEKQDLMMRLYQFEEKTKKAEKGEGEGERTGEEEWNTSHFDRKENVFA